jgi:hypothetical protein
MYFADVLKENYQVKENEGSAFINEYLPLSFLCELLFRVRKRQTYAKLSPNYWEKFVLDIITYMLYDDEKRRYGLPLASRTFSYRYKSILDG